MEIGDKISLNSLSAEVRFAYIILEFQNFLKKCKLHLVVLYNVHRTAMPTQCRISEP